MRTATGRPVTAFIALLAGTFAAQLGGQHAHAYPIAKRVAQLRPEVIQRAHRLGLARVQRLEKEAGGYAVGQQTRIDSVGLLSPSAINTWLATLPAPVRGKATSLPVVTERQQLRVNGNGPLVPGAFGTVELMPPDHEIIFSLSRVQPRALVDAGRAKLDAFTALALERLR